MEIFLFLGAFDSIEMPAKQHHYSLNVIKLKIRLNNLWNNCVIFVQQAMPLHLNYIRILSISLYSVAAHYSISNNSNRQSASGAHKQKRVSSRHLWHNIISFVHKIMEAHAVHPLCHLLIIFIMNYELRWSMSWH